MSDDLAPDSARWNATMVATANGERVLISVQRRHRDGFATGDFLFHPDPVMLAAIGKGLAAVTHELLNAPEGQAIAAAYLAGVAKTLVDQCLCVEGVPGTGPILNVACPKHGAPATSKVPDAEAEAWKARCAELELALAEARREVKP